jgi:hypothetical protein
MLSRFAKHDPLETFPVYGIMNPGYNELPDTTNIHLTMYTSVLPLLSMKTDIVNLFSGPEGGCYREV